MRPGEFVYKSVRDEAIKQGADVKFAETEAEMAFYTYRTNTFKKSVSMMMEKHIAEAVRKTKERDKHIL